MFAFYDSVARELIGEAAEVGLSNISATMRAQFLLGWDPEYNGTRNIYTVGKFISGKGTEQMGCMLQAKHFEDLSATNVSVDNKLGAGDMMPNFTAYPITDTSPTEFTFAAEDPKMYMIDFWNDSIYNNIKRHVNTLSKHPEWEGKVALIAISVADSQEVSQTVFESEGWSTKLTALWAGAGGMQSRLNYELKVNEIPTCLVIQHGKVLHKCNPGWQELEDELEANMVRLLASDQTAVVSSEEDDGILVPEPIQAEVQGKVEAVKVLLDAFIAEGIASNFPNLSYNCSKTYKQNGETFCKEKVSLAGKIDSYMRDAVNALAEKIKEIFPTLKLEVYDW